jgi:mono/diheme cytochrome c family protein
LTEVPEHLLQRSRARRAALGLGGEEGGAPVPAAPAAAATPAAEAAAPTPTPATVPETQPEPAAPVVLPPYVEAAKRRKKIPVWALPVVAFTPIWVLIFALTLDKPTPKEPGPLALGAATYTSCAACHGGSGEGGVGPELDNGKVLQTFPKFADQLYWVMEGTAGFAAQGKTTYGATNKPLNAGIMPAWGDSLTPSQLIGVVRHEREKISGEKFDPKIYDEVMAMVKQEFPAKAADFQAAIDSWKDLPPDA